MRGGVTIDPFNLDDPATLKARVRDQLGEPAFAAAWAQGESLPLDDAIAEADAVLAEAAHADCGARQVADGSAY